MNNIKNKPSGPACASILSASIGCFVIGIAVMASSISSYMKNFFNWWQPAGPLTGKTAIGILFWLILWFIFHLIWQKKQVNLKIVTIVSFILLAIGLIFTFPPFYESFEHN